MKVVRPGKEQPDNMAHAPINDKQSYLSMSNERAFRELLWTLPRNKQCTSFVIILTPYKPDYFTLQGATYLQLNDYTYSISPSKS